METAAKNGCNHVMQNDENKKEYLDFSDDFVFCSTCHNFSPYHKEGYLEKRCSNSWCGYSKRWFLLKNKKLYYFKSKESLRPSGVLDLELIHMDINGVKCEEMNKGKTACREDSRKVTHKYEHGIKRKRNGEDCFLCNARESVHVGEEPPEKIMSQSQRVIIARTHEYCIESRMYKNDSKKESLLILTPRNTCLNFYLRGEDAEIYEWYNLLNSSISSNKIITQPNFIFSESNFWKIDRISADVFESIADTGDIVLFRSNVVSAKLQRIITRGEYDHIGMILRNDKNGIFLLEALSNMGIILTPWELFRKNRWNEAYTRIALRRLTWDNSEQNLNKLLHFLKNTIGKKYNLKIINFLAPKTDDSGYFCSELIGECWKIMGVIPINTKCTYIWPSNFSEKFEEKMKLQEGCQLNNELCIDFTL